MLSEPPSRWSGILKKLPSDVDRWWTLVRAYELSHNAGLLLDYLDREGFPNPASGYRSMVASAGSDWREMALHSIDYWRTLEVLEEPFEED